MSLEVRLDKKVIYKSSFPICQAERSSIHSEDHQRVLHFSFKPRRAIVWQGYRDRDDTTPPNQAIDGDIWLAGSDPDAMALGISFVSNNLIYMNTIHIAYPTRQEQSEIASGLVVITSPASPRKVSKK